MLAILLGLLAALGFSCAGIFARIGLRGVKTSIATAISVVTSFIVIGSITAIYDAPAMGAIAPIAFVWFLASGIVSFPVARLLNYTSVGMIGATRTASIISAQPLFAATLAMLFLGERLNWLLGLGTGIIVAAMIVIVSERQDSAPTATRIDRRFLLGCVIGLAAGAGYGGSSVLTRTIVQDYATPLVGVTFSLMFGSLSMVAVAGRDVSDVLHVPRKSLAIIALAGLCSGGAVTCLFFAFSRAPVIVVSPIVATYPLMTLLTAQVFLRRLEKITLTLVVGTLLVVGGLILVVVGRA